MTIRIDLARISSLIVVALGIGYVIALDIQKNQLMGRDGYLAHQAAYFDKSLSGPPHLFLSALACATVIVLFFVVYEVVAFALGALGTLLKKH